MADIAAVYTLTTPGGTIVFNDGDLRDGTDKYWLTSVEDALTIRTPIDNVPFGDGGIVHDFRKGPRHMVFEGVLIIETVSLSNCRQRRNEMENALTVALESILKANGTLTWTPLGLATRSLTVRNDVPVVFTPIENYVLSQFTFGLVAANPNW
ncbi:MAG: hypothetical protein KatS3mg015_2452 [Fimbriimonadales bacterium]|nr:MAG: hypothetical protein KatS3mg015_2452 [Fimbriimonadales bacterium]